MKRILIAVSLLALIFALSLTVFADIGPKPSVNIEFEGLENQLYYVTLLSKEKSTGPFSQSNDIIPEDHYLVENDKATGVKAWKAFRNYKDADNFYFIEYFEKCNEEQTFLWGYYPPEEFKVLLYFPDTDSFAVSDVYERYAFDSYYSVSAEKMMSQSGEKLQLEAVRSYDYKAEILPLAARILGTIIIELAVALIFRLTGKNLILFIIAVNIVTQGILNLSLNIVSYYRGSLQLMFCYILFEIAVFITEAAAYSLYMRKKCDSGGYKKWTPAIYALTANAASFGAGFLLMRLVPSMF